MTSEKSRTKRQHYVPRFYLDRFTNAEGHIFAYDIKTGESRAAKPDAVGAETNFYSPIQEDGSRFDDMEKWLSTIEAAAAPLFDPLANGRRLAGTDRDSMSAFLATQYLRSPMMINAMADLMGQIAHRRYMGIANSKSESGDIFDEIDRKNGRVTPPEERERIRQLLARPENIKLNVLRDAGLPAIQGVESLTQIIRKLTWVTFDTGMQHIVTSDSPVVKAYDPKTYHPAYGDGGFSNKSMYVTFPLSPNKMLELWWGDGDPGGVYKMDTQRGKFYNKQRVHHSVKFIFSSKEDIGISKLIQKYSTMRRPRITMGDPVPSIEVKRRLD